MIIEDPIVLLVDDSENDVLLMRTVFERAGFVQPLRFVRNGEEAIAYLRGDDAYRDRKQCPLPTVLLLDLNMPRKNGFEVLDWIRHQPALRRLRVYILSASGRAEDIMRAYDLGVNSYLVKPGNVDGLMHLAKCLFTWLRLGHFAPLTDADEDPGFACVDHGRTQPEYSPVADFPAHLTKQKGGDNLDSSRPVPTTASR